VHRFEGCTIIFTGSHNIDLRKNQQALLGRRGKITQCPYEDLDRTLLQPKFSEYVATLNKTIRNEIEELNLHRFETRKQYFLSLIQGDIPPALNRLNLAHNIELNSLLLRYLTTGGFSQATDELISAGRISRATYNEFIDTTVDDLVNWNHKELIAKRILGAIIDKVASVVSLRKLLDDSDISHNTVSSYCEVLGEVFAINNHYNLELHRGIPRPNYRGRQKIYIRDPFMFHACNGWINGRDAFDLSQEFLADPGNTGKLLECVFSDHLARLAFKLQHGAPRFKPYAHVCYWRAKKATNGNGKEVDFLVEIDNKYLPIEAKNTNDIEKKSTAGIRQLTQNSHVHKRGIITSKSELATKDKYVIVPAPLLLLLV
jgi:predicted AAA+ superfamily ATPase